jgi:hypothetical protein
MFEHPNNSGRRSARNLLPFVEPADDGLLGAGAFVAALVASGTPEGRPARVLHADRLFFGRPAAGWLGEVEPPETDLLHSAGRRRRPGNSARR